MVDELGYIPLDAEGARLLFQVISAAYERQSVIFTTNLEFSLWGSVFGDDQMAAAVIDRVVHHGRLVQFRGESWRAPRPHGRRRCLTGAAQILVTGVAHLVVSDAIGHSPPGDGKWLTNS